MDKETENKVKEEILQILAKNGLKAYQTIEELLELIKRYSQKEAQK